MKFEITTLEGDVVSIDEYVGCLHYDVPLREIIAQVWCSVINKYIPIHAIERFELYPEYTVSLDELGVSQIETYTKKLRSLGMSSYTLEIIDELANRD